MYDEALAERIRSALGGREVTERKMFGGLAFLHDGSMSVAASGQGGLMVRVDPARTDELLGRPGVSVVVMRGRPMKGWLRVAATELTGARLDEWVHRGVEQAEAASRRIR